ncbi:MAG: hypothetical protein AMXMBFR58_08160 [Phycisphaerae bacterium]
MARALACAASIATAAPVLIAAVGVAVSVSGCKKEEPPPPPPPPPPEPVQIDPLFQAMKIDARVQFPQEKAPTNEEFARGILSLADALVKGDAGAMQSLLDTTGESALSTLMSSGEWEQETGKIEAIRVIRVVGSGTGGTVSMAIQDPRGAYVLNWAATKTGEKLAFAGRPGPDEIKPRASDWERPGVSLEPGAAIGSTTPGSGDAGEEEGDTPTEEAPAPAEEETPGSDETIKRTPAGPVKIPKPGDGGG